MILVSIKELKTKSEASEYQFYKNRLYRVMK